MSEDESKIIFKKRTKRNLRARDKEDDDDDLGVDMKQLNELKELREFKRNQLRGLSADELLNLKNEVNGLKVKNNKISTQITSTSNVDLINTFSVETNRRDEDADMLKFIEEELAKRKGKKETNEDDKRIKLNANLEEIVFSQLPDHLLNVDRNKNEEMLSNQMLNGIPEVDLGLDEKIRNIEATEDAKRKAASKANKSTKETSFVPNNMAVNYVQHNKFSVNDSGNTNNSSIPHQPKKPKIEPIKLVKEPVVVIGDEPKESIFKIQQTGDRQLKHPGREQASDNYHYEKFKKTFRK